MPQPLHAGASGGLFSQNLGASAIHGDFLMILKSSPPPRLRPNAPIQLFIALHARVRAPHARVRAPHARVRAPHAGVRALHAGVRALHAGVRALHARVRALHTRVRALHTRVCALHARVRALHARVRALHARVRALHARVRALHAGSRALHAGSRALHAVDETLHFGRFAAESRRSAEHGGYHLKYSVISFFLPASVVNSARLSPARGCFESSLHDLCWSIGHKRATVISVE